MASKKQIEANRRNAKKSTGPKTAAGKAKAAQNALKHGLTSRQVVLEDEDAAMYEEVRRNLHLDLQPQSQLELLLVNRSAAQEWRLARIPALEAELIEQLRHDPTGADEGLGAAWTRDAGPYRGALARLARYETAIERSLVRLPGWLLPVFLQPPPPGAPASVRTRRWDCTQDCRPVASRGIPTLKHATRLSATRPCVRRPGS